MLKKLFTKLTVGSLLALGMLGASCTKLQVYNSKTAKVEDRWDTPANKKLPQCKDLAQTPKGTYPSDCLNPKLAAPTDDAPTVVAVPVVTPAAPATPVAPAAPTNP